MNTRTKFLIAFVLVAIGVGGRLLPHAWNFAPIVAIGIFSGAYLGKRFAFAVPALAMIISDAFLGFYDFEIQTSVYISMGLAGLIGLILRKTKNPLVIAAAATAGSTVFFLISNAAVWRFTTMYDPGLSGLFSSLAAGIPFYRNAIVGDVWYSLVLIGAFEAARALYGRSILQRQKQCS